MQSAEWGEAVLEYTESIRLHQMAVTYVQRAKAHRNMANYEAAVNDFQTAINMVPSEAVPYKELGLTYQIMGEFQKTLTALLKYLELSKGMVFHSFFAFACCFSGTE